MTCPRCQSSDLQRSRRRGPLDQCKANLGWWPYRCEDCGHRFHARHRSLPARMQEAPSTRTSDGPAMAYRTEPVKPHAKVVISADTHEQLNHILLALDRAIHSYQPQQQQAEQNTRAYARQ